jgi:hypothetical protein
LPSAYARDRHSDETRWPPSGNRVPCGPSCRKQRNAIASQPSNAEPEAVASSLWKRSPAVACGSRCWTRGRQGRRRSCSCTGFRRARSRGSVFRGTCSRPVTGLSHRTSAVTPRRPGPGPGGPTGSTRWWPMSWPLSTPRVSTGCIWWATTGAAGWPPRSGRAQAIRPQRSPGEGVRRQAQQRPRCPLRRAAELTSRWVTGPFDFKVLEGVSHWIPEQAPDELAGYILERIRSVSPAT